MSFDSAFAQTIGHEGDYADDPNDSGGKTRFGITEAVARANSYRGEMRDLPFSTAKIIAKEQYWNTLRLDAVDVMSPHIAAELFDTSYNKGISAAGKFLQRSLNALNREGKDYTDMVADGLVGPMTVSALRTFMDKRGHEGEQVLLKALNCLQGCAYIELAEKRTKDEAFVYGWLRTRVDLT